MWRWILGNAGARWARMSGGQVLRWKLNATRATVWLWGAIIGYLALPNLIFGLSWLRMPWSILFTLLCLAGFVYALRAIAGDAKLTQVTGLWMSSVTLRQLGGMILGCLLLLAISGIGGYGFQGRDWEKHEVIFRDLVVYPWPIYYDYYGEQVGLAYYLAYYLPPALVGQWSNIWLAHQALAVWTVAGLILTILGFSIVTNRAPHYAMLIFTFFSGLSAVGVFLRFYLGLPILAGVRDISISFGDSLLDAWAPGIKHSSNLTGLLWSPQHTLSGWLITALLLLLGMTNGSRNYTLFLAGLSALWSPFVTLGLFPFFLADLITNRRLSFLAQIRRYISIPNLSGLGILLLSSIFYATKLKPITAFLNEQGMRMGSILAEDGRWDSPVQFVAVYLTFCFLSFGLFFLLDRYQSFAGIPAVKSAYGLMWIWLALLPLITFGAMNDLAKRSSIPALFFVAVIVGRNGYLLQPATRLRKGVWMGALLLAAVNPVVMIGYHLHQIVQRGTWYSLEINLQRNLAAQYATEFAFMQQYASNIDTPFFRYLVKEGAPAVAQNQRGALRFGESILLVNAFLDQQAAQPGDQRDLQLEFRAIQKVAKNYTLAVRLVDAKGQLLWVEQGWPAAAATSNWGKERRIWYDHRKVAVPVEASPQLYRLEIYLTDPVSQAKLPVAAVVSGANLGEIVPIAYLQVGDSRPRPSYPLDAQPHFGGEIALLGSNLPLQATVTPGQPLAVDLVWQAVTWPKLDYTGFVQLLDPQGRLVAQHDQPLTSGFIPATLWTPEFRIADHYELVLPPKLSPGVYQLIVGLYDAATVVRLPVSVDQIAVGDAFRLTELRVGGE